MSRRKLELEVGTRYGKLVVISQHTLVSKCHKWFFKCDCGNKVLIDGSAVLRGNNKSCGCINNRPNKGIVIDEQNIEI